MWQEISYIQPHSAAKIFAVSFAILTIPFLLVSILLPETIQLNTPLISLGIHSHSLVNGMVVIGITFLLGYLLIYLTFVLYNLIARYVGGIVIEIKER